MAPNIQSVVTDREIPLETFTRPLTGDEIVISGISGIFPMSDNTMELMDNLYNKVDMVEEMEYTSIKHPSIPKHYGKIKNMQKFDSQFFRVTQWQSISLDPLSRKAMENSFAAIFDSGINPLSLSGTKLGVFFGTSFSDNVSINVFNFLEPNSFLISGSSKTMMANRISYWIDAKGPSFGLDQNCTSSIACLELAYNSLKRGDCDAALIGGCSACVHPGLSLNLKMGGHLCLDGKTKCFDKNGDGYVRAEAVSIIFLQKAKDAKRIYTEIFHIKGKYFTRPDANFLPIRHSEDIENFLEEFYDEIKMSPSEVEYIEAFGSGIATADGNELNAIGNFFAKQRSIKVGCVKSNMGNTEAASGVCSLTKLCLAYNKGELPANLHYKEPQNHIPAVRDRRIQVVTENLPFSRGFTALNSFSFTGMNFHVLLKGHFKNKNYNRYHSSIPRLVLLSGRNEDGINNMMNILETNPVDPEQIALLHNIFNTNIPGHTGRCYTLLDTNENKETTSLANGFEFYSGTIRPVCFLYSGMGSQWNGMGTELLRIPIFAAAIERCRKILEPLNVDIIKILTDPDKSMFDNVLNSMVGISAIQIGLTDVLEAMGIVPDKIIGHSIGELGCAYADKCFTAEEMILSSYIRGLVSIQTPFIRGSMAAVGLGYNEILPLCPPEIQVACHNSADSATISGPADIMKQFVSDLTSRGIFAREVACSNIAYHSKYIAAAGPALLTSMKKFMQEPKLRSDKWISTSVPQENWDHDSAKYASAEYFTNNLLSPVLFEENASLIPKDAVIIELAPHGLLQAIVKKSHSECVNLSLTKRGNSDSVSFLLQAIGKLYLTGLNPKIDELYPKVEFPVSTQTPPLSHLVAWEHSVDWPQTEYRQNELKETASRDLVMSVYDDEYAFIKGHVRNGINEVPESAVLVFIWETLAMHSGQYYKNMPVTFYNVTFYNQLKIEPEDVLRLKITIQDASNRFEVFTGNTHIVSGFVKKYANAVHFQKQDDFSEGDVILSGQDFYTLLRMKGYSYGDDFQSIHSLNTARDTAYVKWTGEWSTFLDSLLQFYAFARGHDGVSTPKIINRLSIHVDGHNYEETTLLDSSNCYKATMSKLHGFLRCGGVELEGVVFDDKPKVEKQADVLVSREFIPHEPEDSVNLQTAISMNLQLVAENVENYDIKILELVNSTTESLSQIINDISAKLPLHKFQVKSVELSNSNIVKEDVINTQLVVAQNLLSNNKILNVFDQMLKGNVFALTFEQNKPELENTGFDVITSIPTDGRFVVLFKKRTNAISGDVIYIPVAQDSKFSWLSRVQSELKTTRRVVLVSERQPYCGLLGLVKHLREDKGNKIGVIIVDDYHASPFNAEHHIYKKQLQKNLAFNILKKGQWGGYYYVSNSKQVKSQNVRLTKTDSNLENFCWKEIPELSGDLIQISYAGLSARDCEMALGHVTNKTASFGMDFSGVDSRGAQVMGLIAGGALGNTVSADPTLLWPVPPHWSLADAATVPLPYIHAFYILVMKGEIQRKQTVFVMGGAGGLGQAVISICCSYDCTVFTTVSDESKKRFLLKQFPKLKDENIVCLRNESFVAKIKEVTKNKRCHIVINCSNGYLREDSMKCVSFMGKLMDVSNVDINANKNFGMYYLVEGKHYQNVDLATLFKSENINDRKDLQRLMAEGIANGTVRPLSRVVYSPLEISRAFKLVSSRRHRGRALINMSDSKSLFSSNANIVPGVTYSKGVNIVVCDRSNVGVELIDHLIRKGAQNVIVHLKKNQDTNYLYAKASSWKKLNIVLELNSENLQTKEGCERLLKAGQKLGAVTSIFIVQDFKQKVNDDEAEKRELISSYDETIVATANLDMVSRNHCSELRNFVVVSFLSQNIGSEYAISSCERICEARQKIGLPALILRAHVINDNIQENGLLSNLKLSSLVRAVDASLRLRNSNVLTLNLPNDSISNIDEKLGRLFGVENINDIDENFTVKDLYTNDMVIDELKAKLRPITYSTDQLLDMTVASLKNLYSKLGNKSKTNFEAGLRAFYSHVEGNEYLSVDMVIPMRTQIMSFEGHLFVNRSEDHLIIIPGFDGRHQVFESVAERLKMRAVTMQLGPDVICDSIPEIAKAQAKHIQSQFTISSRFHILGYSFGVNVALEIARILESEGRRGVVYCLDSSPDALKSQLKAYVGDLTETQLQDAILIHLFNLMTGQEGEELKQALEITNSWSEKVKICMKSLQGLVHFSIEHRRTILESAYKRILLAKEYEPNFKLQSEVVLIKGIPHPRTENIEEDYSLSKFSDQAVKVFNIESDHAAAPYNCSVSNIVNKMLDPEILENFKYTNRCERYHVY